jgi:hypothetical protein
MALNSTAYMDDDIVPIVPSEPSEPCWKCGHRIRTDPVRWRTQQDTYHYVHRRCWLELRKRAYGVSKDT